MATAGTLVRTGLQRVAEGELADLWRGRRVALLANPTAVDVRLRHAIDVLRERAELVALFGPEHGLDAEAQDMVAVGAGRHARTGLPVFSLYGDREESLAPTPEMLRGVDLLVYDIQDVGCRYYTYPWTLVRALEVCARVGVEVVVLDRPNPLGGLDVEGPGIEPGYESFVGYRSLPIRHGLTVGELAVHCNAGIGAKLTVVTLEGWRRALWYDQTLLPWVMPSPNMPTPDTALVYPGMCLVEGTRLSEGRGTTRPFELFGAPFCDGWRLAEQVERDGAPPGLRLRPCSFRPTFHKFVGQSCGGVQLHVTDRAAFRPVRAGVALLRAARVLWPRDFGWRKTPYEFVADRPAIDLLLGGPRVRLLIDAGAPLADIVGPWEQDEAALRVGTRGTLLYG